MSSLINDKFDMLKWEISGQFWRAAKELGCLEEFEKLSKPAEFRRIIITSFEKQPRIWSVLRRR